MGEKNCLIINYELSTFLEYNKNDSILIPIHFNDISNILKIEFNGNKIDVLTKVINNNTYLVLNEKHREGFNSIKIKVKPNDYLIGTLNNKNIDISFNDAVFDQNIYNNLILDLGDLNIKRIEEKSFYQCKNLISLRLPSELSYIGDHCFIGCENLSSIILKATYAPELGVSVFGDLDLNCVGRNTYSLGINKIYLQETNYGYDKNDWGNILLNETKCGFVKDVHWSFKNL